MAGMANAGLDLATILDFQAKSGPERLLARRLLIRIQRGSSLAGAMAAEGFTKLDTSMIRAAEETGELVTICSSLFDYYQDRHTIERTLKFALLKPVLLFIVSVTTVAFVPFFLGRIGLPGFLARTLLPISVMLIGLHFLFDIFWRASRSSRTDDKLDPWLQKFKVTRDLTGQMALERFFISFLICVKSGASLKTMIDVFRAVASHPSLGGAHLAFDNIVEKKGFADAMKASGAFTDDQISSVRVGEFSGRLEQQLAVVVKDMRGDVDFQMQQFGEWAPRVLYTAMGVFVLINMFF